MGEAEQPRMQRLATKRGRGRAASPPGATPGTI